MAWAPLRNWFGFGWLSFHLGWLRDSRSLLDVLFSKVRLGPFPLRLGWLRWLGFLGSSMYYSGGLGLWLWLLLNRMPLGLRYILVLGIPLGCLYLFRLVLNELHLGVVNPFLLVPNV
jgi:CubicO group peptidase (beta-lactamase class C family)